MSYKRLRSKLKGFQQDSFQDLAHAFEANIKAMDPTFTPVIDRPNSDYNKEINQIRNNDPKLGKTFERLNKHQRHAVFNTAQHVLLSAMVGSGKTTVLIAKIFYLHFIRHVPFEQMLVLTFTNKAAREIKERIGSFMGDIDAGINKQLRYFGTFHAIARQLLQEHPNLEKIGFKPDFMIMDEQEKQNFLDRIIAQENLNIKYQNQLAKRWRNFHQSGKILMGNMKHEDDFAQLSLLAEKEKRQINTMDFDDLISLCNTLLSENPYFDPQWIIVDEFQDCNEEQLQLIEHLRSEHSNIFVVGDQNQSIYGWRGSKEHLFQEMQTRWNATWMELPQNYRSTETILSAAETLLQQENAELTATRHSGDPIEIVRHFDDQQEAYYLREQLLLLQKENVPLDKVAILFRTHQQIKIVETVLTHAGIPSQMVKQTQLHENPGQSFMLCIFKLCINPNDFDAGLALICDSTFGLFKRSKKLIHTIHQRSTDTSVVQIVHDYVKNKKPQIREFLHLLNQIVLFNDEFLPLKDATPNDMIDFLKLRPILKPTSIHHADYLAAVTEARDQINRYMHKQGWGDRRSIFHIAIDQVVLEGTFQINDRIKTQSHGVHLLTIHASKGLEFDRVYIAGVNTGIIPLTQHQKGSGNLKEEKRLLFVAITRSRNKVEMGWHVQPVIRNAEPEPSYFLNAIPETLLKRSISAVHSSTDTKKEEQASEEWSMGISIQHKKYGQGKIMAVDEKELVCVFDSFGEKSFSKAFAKVLLTKVDQ